MIRPSGLCVCYLPRGVDTRHGAGTDAELGGVRGKGAEDDGRSWVQVRVRVKSDRGRKIGGRCGIHRAKVAWGPCGRKL
jgi:hypothetical protein